MTRYSHDAKQSSPAAVGVRETPGQRHAVPNSPESRLPDPQSSPGWRTGPQNARSRGPPQRIRRKAQPETEGIGTFERNCLLERHEARRKAQPETEGIETDGRLGKLPRDRPVAKPETEGVETAEQPL